MKPPLLLKECGRLLLLNWTGMKSKLFLWSKTRNNTFYYIAAASVIIILFCLIFFTNRSSKSANEQLVTSSSNDKTQSDTEVNNNVIMTVPIEEKTILKNNTDTDELLAQNKLQKADLIKKQNKEVIKKLTQQIII